MSKVFEFVISDEDDGIRADKAAGINVPGLTRSAAEKLFETGLVSVNGKTVSKSSSVHENDIMTLDLPDPVSCTALPENIPLDIIFEDDDLLVVNKPQGMCVHPAPGNPDHTLVNALLYHCGSSLSGIGGVLRPGIVHRIDKDTSGLLMVAKNDFTHTALSAQIKEHDFERRYKTIVHGNVKDDSGIIDLPIGRSRKDRKKMAVVTDGSGRESKTKFIVIDRFNDFTYLDVELFTGRTHQIRVHMAYTGHPVAGDPLYGPKNGTPGLSGQCLHAYHLGFVHPRTKEHLVFEAPLPLYFENFLEKLKRQRS
jgi:23S rRNA pseudouridine1911/1915/1917 synthase